MTMTEVEKLEMIDKVLEYVLKRFDGEVTEDLIQDIAIMALEKYPTFDENRVNEYMRLMYTKTYVLRTLNSQKEKDCKFEIVPISEEEVMDMINNAAIQDYNSRYTRYMISSMLDTLTTPRRALFIKCNINGYTSKEIGIRYNISSGYSNSIIRFTIPRLIRKVNYTHYDDINLNILDDFLVQ